jgi:hypothetical protein
MKTPKRFGGVALATICLGWGAASLSAASGEPVLRGVLVTGSERLFSLSIPGSAPAWVEVGKTFEGWKVKEYREAGNVLVLTRDGIEKVLPLAESVISASELAGTAASLEDAETLLTQMRFEEMLVKTIEQQKDATIQMMSQMFNSRSGAKSPADSADFEAFQRKATDAMFEAMDLPGMKKDMAKIYAEVFTKEELRAQADFYATAGGKAMLEKQPAMQQKMMAVMGPRMMAAMPKVQALGMEFAKEQAAKRQAARAAAKAAETGEAAAPAPAAAPPAPPEAK